MIHPDKYNCSGCSCCKEVCSRKAISMEPDGFGFLYPKVDNNLCTNCGLCEKACPFNDNYDKTSNLANPICYAAKHKDTQEVKTSTSGAMFIAIADWFIENNGAIYGAGYDNRFNVKHIRVTTKKDLFQLKGSKYVQSDIRCVYPLVLRDLKMGLYVLFSGTPCQTAGLRSFLSIKQIELDKLFCIDIICHGVPSPYFYRDYLHYLEFQEKGKILNFNFRDEEKFGWSSHIESITFRGGEKI